MRRLAGLGGPWRPKKHTQTTTGLFYAAAWCAKCVFSAVSKPASLGSTSQRFLSNTKKPGGWRIVASAAELETNFEFEDLSEGDESGDESDDDESDDGNGDDEGGSSDDDDE